MKVHALVALLLQCNQDLPVVNPSNDSVKRVVLKDWARKCVVVDDDFNAAEGALLEANSDAVVPLHGKAESAGFVVWLASAAPSYLWAVRCHLLVNARNGAWEKDKKAGKIERVGADWVAYVPKDLKRVGEQMCRDNTNAYELENGDLVLVGYR